MNIETEYIEPTTKTLDRIFDVPEGNEHSYKIVEKIERLENEISTAKDQRLEERFYWICATVFLANVIFAKFLDNIPLFFILLMAQLFMLAGLAKRLGVDWAVEAIERICHWLDERIKRGKA